MEFEDKNKIVYANVRKLIFNWFRDDKGIDKSIVSGISLGNLISCSAVIYTASIYKEYMKFQYKFQNEGTIRLNKNEHPLRQMVAQKTDKNFSPNDDTKVEENFFPLTREFVHVYGKKQISGFLSSIQWPFLGLTKQPDKLYLNDWTYGNLKREKKNSLFLNSKNIINGAYTSNSLMTTKPIIKLLPDKLDKGGLLNGLLLQNSMLHIPFSRELIDLYADYTVFYYNKYKDHFNEILNTYAELLKRYNPKSVVFPGEHFEPFVLIKGLCEEMGISTEFMLDGYSLFPINPILKNKKNSSDHFDKYIAFSNANRAHFIMKGVSSEKIEVIKWPVFTYYDQYLGEENIFDFIIMTWQVNDGNPSNSGTSFDVLEEVIILLRRLDFRNIAIKVKSPKEIKEVNKILKKLNVHAEILTGHAYKHLMKGRKIIGGISSAVAEASYCNRPYYIYERNDLGNNNYVFNDSLYLNESLVARKLKRLEANIYSNNSALSIRAQLLS